MFSPDKIPVYQFASPFVKRIAKKDSEFWQDDNPYPRPDPETLVKIQNHILTWMGREGIILALNGPKGEVAYYLNHKKDTSSLAYLFGETNMMALPNKDYYAIFKQALYADPSNKTMIRLAALPFWLGTLFSHDDINYLVHATYQSVDYMISDSPEWTWDAIHIDMPFMWIILIANTLIHTYVRPITEAVPDLASFDKK